MAPLARTALLVGVGVAGASYLAPGFLKSPLSCHESESIAIAAHTSLFMLKT